MKSTTFIIFLVFIFCNVSNAQRHFTTSEEKEVIANTNTGAYGDKFGVHPPVTYKDCSIINSGELKLINKSRSSAMGKIFYKRVNPQTGEVSGLFSEEFNLSPGSFINCKEVSAGFIEYEYVLWDDINQRYYDVPVKKSALVEPCRINEADIR